MIPFVFSSYVEDIILSSLKELAELIKFRYEDHIVKKTTDDDHSSLNISSKTRREFGLPQKTLKTTNLDANTATIDVITQILENDSTADASLLAYWFSKKSNGSELIHGLLMFYNKMIAEEIRTSTAEPTAYIAHLALIKLLRNFKTATIKNIRVRGVTLERLDRLFSNILHVLLTTAIKSSLKQFEKKQVAYNLVKLEYLLLATVSPMIFSMTDKGTLKNDYNIYHIPLSLFESIAPLYEELKSDAPLADRVKSLQHKLKKDIQNKALYNAKLIRFRYAVLEYLFENDNQKDQASNYLLALIRDSKLLDLALNNSAEMVNSENCMKILHEKSKIDENIQDYIHEIETRFDLFKAGSLKSKFLIKTKDELSNLIRNFICAYEDNRIKEVAGTVIEQLNDKRGTTKDEELDREYHKGRLYRFANDDMDTLKELSIKREGQLFIDLKDYTKKTYRAKEIVMADFMMKEFYLPILSAGKKYFVGVGSLDGSKNVTLNNLLGDAVAFSGTVHSLVNLAEDIQNIAKEYEKKLRRIEFESSDFDPHEVEHDDGGLDSGLFISYGAPAEIIDIEDEVWGSSKVAIAEKINEAARGTARNKSLRKKLLSIIREEEERRQRKNLLYPFAVYIDNTYAFNFDIDMASALELAIKNKDKELAKKLSQSISKLCYNGICSAMETEDGGYSPDLTFVDYGHDIYNLGEAMSIEAVIAYIKEVKDKKNFFKQDVRVSDFNKAILDEFVFPVKLLKFIVFTEKYNDKLKVDLFRYAGQVKFKGFEAKENNTMVFEIIRKDSLFYNLLMKHHLNDWIQEAKKTGYASDINVFFKNKRWLDDE